MIDMDTLLLRPTPPIDFKKEKRDTRGKRHDVQIRSCKFEGLLTVTDLDAFKNALINGIGHGKAYGLGLLNILPVN